MSSEVTADANAISVAFVPTVDDQVRANREILRRRGWRRVEEYAVLVFGVLFLSSQVWLNGWGVLFGRLVLITIVWMVLVALLLAVPLITRWGFVRQRRQNPHLVGPMSFVFTDSGVHVQSPLGTADMPWSSFVRARETPEMLLLYFAKKTAYFVPRRALREADEARLRALVVTQLGARAELMKPTDDR